MKTRHWLPIAIPVASTILLSVAVADGTSDAKETLEKKGIRVSTSTLSLTEESSLSKQLRDVVKVRKTLLDGVKMVNAATAKMEENERTVNVLRQRVIQLNGQLAALNPNNIALNNKLVGAINAMQNQMQLFEQQRDKMQEQFKKIQRNVNDAREKYIQCVLDMRKTADKIEERYATLAADADVKSALEKLNEGAEKKFDLEPSRTFQSNVRTLKRIEDTILSEKIPLEREGNSFWVSVVIDGKHTQRMVVDSGASILCLPYDVAMECGLEPVDSDPSIELVIADGSVIDGKLKTIDSVRVGKFTVEDVECAVLSPVATHATCLLGMSFLGHFKFELDAQAATLTMIKIGDEDQATPSRPSRRRSRR